MEHISICVSVCQSCMRDYCLEFTDRYRVHPRNLVPKSSRMHSEFLLSYPSA